jgi:hypothetical protein
MITQRQGGMDPREEEEFDRLLQSHRGPLG